MVNWKNKYLKYKLKYKSLFNKTGGMQNASDIFSSIDDLENYSEQQQQMSVDLLESLAPAEAPATAEEVAPAVSLAITEEPSLNDLYKFIENYHLLNQFDKEFFDNNSFDVVYAYIYNTDTKALHAALSSIQGEPLPINKTPLSSFWLAGQKRISSNEPITDEIIDEVEELIKKAPMPATSAEYFSVREHNQRWEKFKVLLKNYKEFVNHKLFEPGAEGYLAAKESFESNL